MADKTDLEEETEVVEPKMNKDEAEQSKRMNASSANEDKQVDTEKSKEAAALLSKSDNASSLKAQRDRELALVKVNEADVEFLVHEFEITKNEADRHLRINNGDVNATVQFLINKL